MNITHCLKCGRALIEEEVESHKCRKVVDYKIEGYILWLYDGDIWYPRKLKPNNRHLTGRNTNREDNRTLNRYLYKVLVPYHTVRWTN